MVKIKQYLRGSTPIALKEDPSSGIYHEESATLQLQLFAWGLRPETAVGCALDFLFQPRAEVLDLVRDNFMALSDPQTLKIGIHVRL